MRVAQVITLFLPEFVGGATLACARITRGLRARGHEVAVFCGRPGAEASAHGIREWEVDGVAVTGVDAASGYVTLDVRGYHHPEVGAHFARFLDRVRPEIVHLHSIQALGGTLVDAAVERGIPVVVTMHDWWWFCVRLFLVDPAGFVCAARVDSARCHCAPGFDLVARRGELERVLAMVTRVLTPSRFLADAAIANGVDPARVAVCPNGVDPPVAHVRRRPGPVRFGYFGGPDNRLKGLPTLLAAAAALDVGGWTLRLFAVSAREAAIPLARLDRITAAPAFAPANLGDVLAGLDCLVVPSLMRESYSLVTREALAAGVPVLTTDCGGPQEIVTDGVNGLVSATGDAIALRERMRRLVLEPTLRERLTAGAAATRVPTVVTQLDQLEGVYHDAVSATASAARARRHADTPAAARHSRSVDVVPVRRSSLQRVLFVSGIDGPPFRYRVTHLREQLHARGVASAALYYTDARIPDEIGDADLVVVYRVPMGAYVASWLARARALRRPLVFSCDDLVFDATAAPEDALALLPCEQRAGWRAYGARYAETLRACDAFLGSTEPLVAAAERLGVRGSVVRNALGGAELAVAESARHAAAHPAAVTARHHVRLAYLSGTIMHDLDFALIEPVLAELLTRHAALHLVLVGYLATGAALAGFADRVERLPFQSWPRLFATLAAVDVNLAPLRDDAFSDAKSEVKYLEAAAVGVPTVASPTSAFRHAIRHGVNGLLAARREDWRAALDTLITHPSMRRGLGNAAHDDVTLHAGPAARAGALLDALEELRAAYTPASLKAHADADPPPADTADLRGGSGRVPSARDAAGGAGEIGRYDLEPDDAWPDAAQPARDQSSPLLTRGRSLGQLFRADADGLTRIDVCVATGAAGVTPALVLHVAAEPPTPGPHGGSEPAAPSPAIDAGGGRVLRRTSIAAGAVAEDGWLAAEFEPIGACAGRALYFWVELADGDDTPAITLRTYSRGWGEPPPAGLHVDHTPVAGSLAFRTFRRRSALILRDASPSPSPSPP